MEKLSNNIREQRFKIGEMTQKALAAEVGISRQAMNAIENCRHAPTVSVAIRIADVFSVTVDELFSLDYEGKPARLERATRVTVDRSRSPIIEQARAAPDRSRSPIEQPVTAESRPKQGDEEAERQTTLADLRNVV